ncbi:MAG TPA: pyridoxamine 5'-phosphate oxidase family protein [Cyclobacteriaceae bacterium]|nr:pyridoxamine 5'-phosphate oxidase family protein [Cyclobacteriaceae bacterium]
MLGELSEQQIDEVLNSQVVGRIGCYGEGTVYVVPVTYAYQDGYIYAHSSEGTKIRMMRENPQVCFEVEDMENMANWRSVIAWGTYEELTEETQRDEGLRILFNRISSLVISETVRPHRQTMSRDLDETERKNVVYRIRVQRRTGRFEESQGSY